MLFVRLLSRIWHRLGHYVVLSTLLVVSTSVITANYTPSPILSPGSPSPQDQNLYYWRFPCENLGELIAIFDQQRWILDRVWVSITEIDDNGVPQVCALSASPPVKSTYEPKNPYRGS